MHEVPILVALDLGVTDYVDTKEGDAVAVVAAVGDVSHFLDDAAVGQNVPLQIIQIVNNYEFSLGTKESSS
jgi:predicted RNA-binding protein with TRAM domain